MTFDYFFWMITVPAAGLLWFALIILVLRIIVFIVE